MKKQFNIVNIAFFILMGLIIISCSGTSGRGGTGLNVDETDNVGPEVPVLDSVCPSYMPLDDRILSQYEEGLNVFIGDENIGCLSFVSKPLISPSTPDFYKYAIVNQQGYMFYLTEKGIFSNVAMNFNNFYNYVQVENNHHTGNNFKKVIRGHYRGDSYACQMAYMPQPFLKIKDQRYPNNGDLKFFYVYRDKEESDITYACLDISAANKVLEEDGVVSAYEFRNEENNIETWGEENTHTERGTFVGYDGKVLSEDASCLNNAFLSTDVPDYTGSLVFKTKEGKVISMDEVNQFGIENWEEL